MSNLKITGNTTPMVGVPETYSIVGFSGHTPLQQAILSQNPSGGIFENQIKWTLWILENGIWKEKPKNAKTGATVTYTFSQQSLKRRGIRLKVETRGETATITIKTKKGPDAKIIDVVLLDAEFKKPTKPFAYGDSIIASIHCVNMDLRMVKATLWEDDAKGNGHNSDNTKIQYGEGPVKDGRAYIKFLLSPNAQALSNSKLAAGDQNEGKTHEYYITAEVLEKAPRRVASKNTNVANPDYKPEEPKQTPAQQKGPSKREERGILDSAGAAIHDYYEKAVSVMNEIAETSRETVNSLFTIDVPDEIGEQTNCGERFCIKKGDKNELIREINIRLAGFGGNVPTDEFTDRTEKMIKQFQRDYMKVPETGKVCGNVLVAIDEFQKKYPINFNEIKCKCGHCSGYGKERNSEQYQSTSVLEKYRKYEYPGIHRSLVSAYRASIFYINKDKSLNYKTRWIESGYRCHDHPIYISTGTTNHCGKALDIHYNYLDTGKRARSNSDMNKIRKEIFKKYTGAKEDWNSGKDIFYLESFAESWIHFDVREFSQEYLTKKYFVTNFITLNGKNILALANEMGLGNLCSCSGISMQKEENTNEKKYKWSHSEFGNLIAKKESGDDYNICNQTKGGLKVIYDVKVVELTIKEIQIKQQDRDVFAVGRYQLIPITLNDAIIKLDIDVNEKLDEEMQDKIFDEYLIKVKRPSIIDYLEGDGGVENAMYSSAQEWASIGVEKGKRISDKKIKKEGKEIILKRYATGGESYYAGDGLNKAHITPEEIKDVLTNSKNTNE